jgi:hypothetical protein
MSHSLYPSLLVPELDYRLLKRGLKVQTRVFYADSLPGREATVVRFWTAHNGTWVRCNYGKNLSGKSLLKTMPANVLALAAAGDGCS